MGKVCRQSLVFISFVCLMTCFFYYGCSATTAHPNEMIDSESGIGREASGERIKEARGEVPTVREEKASVHEPTQDAGEPTPDNAPDTSPDGKVAPDTGGIIRIYLAGDSTKQTFNDGLAAQTPFNYSIALGRYFIMRAKNDPAPQLCFDHGKKSVVADMSKDNLMGSCKTQSLKTGIYTYGKVKVDWLKYSVKGTYHYGGVPIPGTFTFFRAYSSVTFEGKSFKPGQGWIRFEGPTKVEIPYAYEQKPNVPGLQIELTNGEFFMIFPYKKGLPIDRNNTQEHWARFHWKIYDAFRWKDMTLPGYKKDVWDTTSILTTSEQVKVFGVTSYYITSSVD